MVVDEVFGGLFLAKFFERICPKNVAHQSMGGRLAETINLGKLALFLRGPTQYVPT